MRGTLHPPEPPGCGWAAGLEAGAACCSVEPWNLPPQTPHPKLGKVQWFAQRMKCFPGLSHTLADDTDSPGWKTAVPSRLLQFLVEGTLPGAVLLVLFSGGSLGRELGSPSVLRYL